MNIPMTNYDYGLPINKKLKLFKMFMIYYKQII